MAVFLLPCTSRVLSFSDKGVGANRHLHRVMCGSVLHDFEVYTIKKVSKKGADQTARMRRLICAFQVLLMA